MRVLVGGQGYKILVGHSSFDATVGDYILTFVKDKERLIVKRNDRIVLEVDGFFVRSLTGTRIENKGMQFVIESSDFVLTYEFLKFIRFRTDDCSLVVELSGE